MPQREPTPTPVKEAAITLEDATRGGLRTVAASTPCVNAGPKYRALDRNGVIDATMIDRADLMTLDATIVGSLVYVPDASNGHIPQLYRLHRVTSGRPDRLPGAPH
jgi:hypothetical protein